MSTPSARRGASFERTVRDYLRSLGFPAERIPAGMTHDRGDISGIPGWTIEIKSYSNVQRAVSDGLADLEVEQANADTPHGLVVVKRRGVTDPGRQLAVLELWQWAGLVRRG